MQATDLDYGANAQLVYMIPPGLADNKFIINPSDGVIRTNASLDIEVKDVYTFSGNVDIVSIMRGCTLVKLYNACIYRL